MTADERIRLCLLLDRMAEQKAYCRKIGLTGSMRLRTEAGRRSARCEDVDEWTELNEKGSL